MESNGVQLELANARAARAADGSGKAFAAAAASTSHLLPSPPGLTKDEIVVLHQNCIRLASENKINQKNTWELNLLDHLGDIIKAEMEGDSQINFQKLSCTLEAGVRIYASRVDSVHSEAYKVLGRMIQAMGEDKDPESAIEGYCIESEQDEIHVAEETDTENSHQLTLQSFESLNMGRLNVALEVDPLFRQTSSQLDEGRGKGLLLNNLGVYGGCEVLFDSMRAPGRSIPHPCQAANSDIVDLSSLREMVMAMRETDAISPSLRDIVHLHMQRQPLNDDGSNSAEMSDPDHNSNFQLVGSSSGQFEAGHFDHYDDEPIVNIGNDLHEPSEAGEDVRSEQLLQGLRLTSNQNASAGPDHWKFMQPKDTKDVSTSRAGRARKKSKSSKQGGTDIEDPNIFAAHENPESNMLLIKKAVPRSHTLPEYHHYQPEDLSKRSRKRRRISDDNSWEQNNDFDEEVPLPENVGASNGNYDDGFIHSNPDDSAAPVCQASSTEPQFHRTSKALDIRLLKETLWDHIQESVREPEVDNHVSFKCVLATLPPDCQAAVPGGDLSPHMCFVCLLHLANEHGFNMKGSPNLDDLSIELPSS